MADKVDVFFLQPGAKQGTGDHREGHLHEVRVNIYGTDTDLPVEITQRLREGVLHNRGQHSEIFETSLDETPLGAPCFPMRGEKALPQEMAHPLYLDLGFLVVLRIGL